MTLYRHELRQGLKSFLIWLVSIGFFIAVCIFMYPEMKKEMNTVTDLFASMGAFSSAFGMDKLNFGTLIGFYAVECGNILGLGGAFYAALTGASIIAKEEKEHTAEYLLTHPVSRFRIAMSKFLAVMTQILVMNIILFLISILSVIAIGEEIEWEKLVLLHAAYTLLQLELGGICFGISAFITGGYAGIGLGLASVMYFLNITANITQKAEVLKYFTPFSYADGADLLEAMKLDMSLLIPGIILFAVCAAAGFVKYMKKDIH